MRQTRPWKELVRRELERFRDTDAVAALWRRDPAAWVAPSPGGTPAADATGWLDLPGRIDGLRGELTAFADAARSDGFTDVVLLGMGGSSLGPLVLGSVFGTAAGYLRLHVLDSTVPGQVTAVRDRVDPGRTLFLVSSKSGTTIEPLTLMSYFRWWLEEAGVERPDASFVAMTDPGTPLESLARERGFRQVFSTPEDVGGRFSVLSSFGLLPAALTGVDLARFAKSALRMAEACGPGAEPDGNPGAALGATLGGLAAAGRDKVTIISSPGLASLGLWIEQLLAESTGKNGNGLVPIAGEPLYDASGYGEDRNFIYVRLAGDDNSRTDAHANALENAGQPVTLLDMNDEYDLAAEFFRWEFAVALAAQVISVYPFDQPDVESAKELTRNLLASGNTDSQAVLAPAQESGPGIDSGVDLLRQAGPGDYVAILGYIPASADVEDAVSELRAAITRKTGAATTFGYGPRYLHSTGQLHKGGPASVIGLALAAGNEDALAAPGAEHGFESLFIAQLSGDVEALRSNGRRSSVTVLRTPYADAIRGIAADLERA
ncbi:MAG: glucose-6-phosphate isomerase [Chloroflexi bacterium]|nr:glucose-6-phosphate isomerase [Chloroflexota bacterium]